MATKGTIDLSSVFRKLTSVLLISSATFAKATPTQQTEVLSQTGGLPVLFVPNFHDLQNADLLRRRLLSGEDVSRELEFNAIELTDEDKRALSLIQPVLAKIAKIGPVYPWVEEKDYSKTIEINDDYLVKAGYKLRLDVAKRIWDRASHHWSGGPVPSEFPVRPMPNDSTRYVSCTKTRINVGCQHMLRSEVEFVARALNWEPIVYIKK